MSANKSKLRANSFVEQFPTGIDLIREPALNKGSAFTDAERERFKLRGLLPPRVMTEELQLQRSLRNFRRKTDDLDQYVHLASLADRNEQLFYKLVIANLEETLPIIYTPTVGRACQVFGHVYRKPRGIFVSAEDRGRMADVLRNWPHPGVRVIVVTDGGRILGLGDLGANGMGIPVGKLSLYTACAGVHPELCLPVVLDAGTDNEALLNDPLYIGLKQHRLTGDDYDELFEEFVTAVQEVFPHCLIQFEDLANVNAFRILDRYRGRVCSFNDDIQGTGAVALAGLYSALRITGGALSDQTILFLGAGEAGIGISDTIAAAIVEEGASPEEAKKRCWLFDSKGLVVSSRRDLNEDKRRYAHEETFLHDFLSAVQRLKPDAIIGVSGQPGTFTPHVLQAVGRLKTRPIIFALSNPTSRAECTAEEAYHWTEGRAIFASGSPFSPVEMNGRTLIPGQGNNAYIFPGLGLGTIATESRLVTDEMFFAAAKTLAGRVTAEDLEQGLVYPPIEDIRDVSLDIGVAVAEVAYQRDLARRPRPDDLRAYLDSQRYDPNYPSYV